MKKFAILAVVAAFAFLFTALIPQPADAGWRRNAWRQGYYVPGRVYVAPRYGYYTPRSCARVQSYRSPLVLLSPRASPPTTLH